MSMTQVEQLESLASRYFTANRTSWMISPVTLSALAFSLAHRQLREQLPRGISDTACVHWPKTYSWPTADAHILPDMAPATHDN